MDACARPAFDPLSKSGVFAQRFVPDRYEVFLRGREPTQPSEEAPASLGTGDARWAAAILERAVPANWGAAVDGTCEDST